MNNISTKGVITEERLTLKHTGLTKADEGKLVKLSANNTVALCTDGDLIFGVLESVENEVATVQITGVVTITYTGTAPTLNYVYLAASGSSSVKTVAGPAAGIRYRILEVNTSTNKVTFILK